MLKRVDWKTTRRLHEDDFIKAIVIFSVVVEFSVGATTFVSFIIGGNTSMKLKQIVKMNSFDVVVVIVSIW